MWPTKRSRRRPSKRRAMNIDVIQKNRDLRRYGEPTGFDGVFWTAFALLLMLSLSYFFKAANTPDSELARQSALAAQVNFLDPAGIWKLSRYPVWSISFAMLYKLGVPLAWAAAIVSTLYIMLSFVLAQRIFRLYLGAESSFSLATLAALVLVFAASASVPLFYTPADSLPPLWQDPRLPAGFAVSLLCLFYSAHCLYFLREQRIEASPGNLAVSWRHTGILSALLLLSALTHPAFLWVFLPAWLVYLAALFIKNPHCRRGCLPMLAAALPAAVCVVLQGNGSGIALSLSFEGIVFALRDMLLLVAFPLLTLLLLPRKETFRDPVIRLSLSILATGVIGAAFVQNTGSISQGLVSASLLLWVVMLPRFIDQVFVYRYERLRLQEDARRGAIPAAALMRVRGRLNQTSLGLLAGLVLLLWQVYTGVHALYRLLIGG